MRVVQVYIERTNEMKKKTTYILYAHSMTNGRAAWSEKQIKKKHNNNKTVDDDGSGGGGGGVAKTTTMHATTYTTP